MAEQRVLIVANETLGGRELLLMLEHLDQPKGLSSFHVVVPSTHSDNFAKSPLVDERGRVLMDQAGVEEAQQRLDGGMKLIAALGAEVTGEIGPPDPLTAVRGVIEAEAKRREHDRTVTERTGAAGFPFAEIIVSTLPHRTSRWLRMDFPHRLARSVDIPVRHVECTPNEDLAAAVELSRQDRQKTVSRPEPALEFEYGFAVPDELPDRAVKVLLVEDSSADVELARLALDRGRVRTEVTPAQNGRVALDLLQSDAERPDLILLDLKMPTMNGHDFLEEVNNIPALADLPVVIVTTSDLDSDRTRAHELGAHAYITKDSNFVLFQEMLEGVVTEFARHEFAR